MGARTGRITEAPSPRNGWRTGYDPEPERGPGESIHTAREMRMLEEIERLRKVLDPDRQRPGWGARAWQPRPGEVGADGTRY
jgi:hypothetical protein